MATRDAAVLVDAHPREDVAAKAFDQRSPLADGRTAPRVDVGGRRRRATAASASTIWRISARLWPTSRMRIQTRSLTSPPVADGHLECQRVVRRIAERRVARRKPGRTRGRRSRRRRTARRVRALSTPVPTVRSCSDGVSSYSSTSFGKRCAMVVDDVADRRRCRPRASRTDTPPGTTRSIISRWPKAVRHARSTRSRSTPQCACISVNDASLQTAPMSPR